MYPRIHRAFDASSNAPYDRCAVSKSSPLTPEQIAIARAAGALGKRGGQASWEKLKASSTPEERAQKQLALAIAGGKARFATLTPEEVHDRAVAMAKARWAKHPDVKGGRPRKPSPPILLPQTNFKRNNQLAHIRLLTAVKHSRKLGQWIFEGTIHKPGSKLQNPPACAVAIECVGVAGKGQGVLWVLWQRVKDEWIELARSQSTGREWTLDLGPRAAGALNLKPKLFDVVDRVNLLASEIVAFLDLKLDPEAEGVALGVLLAVADQVNGRIAQNDSVVSRAELFG